MKVTCFARGSKCVPSYMQQLNSQLQANYSVASMEALMQDTLKATSDDVHGRKVPSQVVGS